jgi:hypothetical protein
MVLNFSWSGNVNITNYEEVIECDISWCNLELIPKDIFHSII